ncbi:MAG: packaged DNA stabilization protein, partial [Pikeienuella sp.]
MKTIFAAQSLLHEGQLALTTEQLVNVYPEIMPGRLPLTIRSCPGLIDVGQFAEGRTEAMLSALDGIYAVCGGLLVRWDGSTFTNLGTVGLGRATMQYNGTQVAVTVGGKYYIYDGTSLTEVTGFAFNTVGSVEFMDGYFMTTDVNSDRWAITAINDGTSIDALDFASAESRPDNLVRIIANGGLVWLMGEETVEPWQNTGNADFPFQRISSTVIEKGLRSVGEATRLDNTIFWNSDESRAYRQVDFQPQKISTASVDTSLDA